MAFVLGAISICGRSSRSRDKESELILILLIHATVFPTHSFMSAMRPRDLAEGIKMQELKKQNQDAGIEKTEPSLITRYS